MNLAELVLLNCLVYPGCCCLGAWSRSDRPRLATPETCLLTAGAATNADALGAARVVAARMRVRTCNLQVSQAMANSSVA